MSLPAATLPVTTLPVAFVTTEAFASWLLEGSPILAFNRELDLVRAEDAWVAAKRELGDLRDGRVVMVGSRMGRVEEKGDFFLDKT